MTQMGQMIHEELSRKIIGAAMDVLNKMKPGLDEKLYERALLIELRRRGDVVESQKEFPVFYESELIDNLVPDLIVDDKVTVDPKVVLHSTKRTLHRWSATLPLLAWNSLCCSTSRALVWNGNELCDSKNPELILQTSMLNLFCPRYPRNSRFSI
jgi:GxxExxY protein